MSPLGRLLGSPEALWEPPGALLAASWSLLGRSWGGLGASWAPLGPSWRRPNVTKITYPKKVNFKTPHGGHRPSFCPSQRRPKSTQIGPKTSQNLRQFSRAKQLLFKCLLETSWADLGAFWRASWGPKLRSGNSGRSIW